MKYKLFIYLCLTFFLYIGLVHAQEIDRQVISSGGKEGIADNMVLLGTIGQTAIGIATATDVRCGHGFWQALGAFGCCDTPGDADNNGIVNILDITYIIVFLYQLGPAPDCMDEADANGNNNVNILDITYLIANLYHLPPGPAPICGTTGL